MPAVTIINKSFAASGSGVFIGRYNFCNARERLSDRRNFLAQINQQITIPGRRGFATDRDRGRRIVRRAFEYVVWHKTSVPECPQEVIHLLYRLAIGGMNVDSIVETIGFLGKAAGKSLPGLFTRAVDDVEIDF